MSTFSLLEIKLIGYQQYGENALRDLQQIPEVLVRPFLLKFFIPF